MNTLAFFNKINKTVVSHLQLFVRILSQYTDIYLYKPQILLPSQELLERLVHNIPFVTLFLRCKASLMTEI